MKFIMTEAGKELQAKLLAGRKLIFTKAEASGEYSSVPEELKAVQNMKQSVQLGGVSISGGKAILNLTLTNLDLSEGYILKQLGIYAKAEGDSEVLYLIGQDSNGETVPPISDKEVELEYVIKMAYDSAYEISAETSGNDFIKRSEFEVELDDRLKLKVSTEGGDISHTKVNSIENSVSEYPLAAAGDSISKALGKISKYLSDLKAAVEKCFTSQEGLSLKNRIEGYKTVRLTASDWSGLTAPYSQTVNVSGITASDRPTLSKALTGSESETVVKAYNKAFSLIFSGNTSDGAVTFYVSKKPQIDFTVGLKGV